MIGRFDRVSSRLGQMSVFVPDFDLLHPCLQLRGAKALFGSDHQVTAASFKVDRVGRTNATVDSAARRISIRPAAA
jgi:hypothetical protein